MTSYFNFRSECNKKKIICVMNLLGLYKYDQEIYEIFMDSFDLMPLVCVINGKFLALHGGISPELKSVIIYNEINQNYLD